MGIVKIANEAAERLIKEIPAPKQGMRYSQRAGKEVPVYRIVFSRKSQLKSTEKSFKGKFITMDGILCWCFRVS
jgi:hypothetical protein